MRAGLLAGRIGAVLLTALAVGAVAGPWLLSTDGRERLAAPYAPPSADRWLGADDLGRDLFAQLVIGARGSLGIALLVALAATTIAALVGGLAGLAPPWAAGIVMRVVDLVLALPFLPLLILAAAFLGPTLGVRAAVVAALVWAGPARLIRAGVLAAWSRGHLQAARAMGASAWYLLLRHASPVVAPLLVPVFVRAAMTAIVLDASLAFLGLGDPTSPSWGTMIHWASVRGAMLTDAWLWWALPPGLAIVLTVTALALVGVATEDRLNPTLRQAR
ncbi:ABC transporter permease [Micromonospora endophytica]|uniref:ABC transporter permease n=1 Tax=Micromonospora endophytica TaxID=515350 RepID=A0A2W2DDR7_9ACTN|nr:ABC transporter permease [Micromonospora endophytica]PZF95256.1 ABC transporter permease [Micromonospora endophytica]RIW50833.1 ABC transporter permease [Micromonospora endophytica]